MKIGILTYHSVPNFGAQLQAISTVCRLQKMGHDPIVLNWYPDHLKKIYIGRVPKVQMEAHDRFTNTFPSTQLCKTCDDLVSEIKRCGIEAVIVGSDALFKYIPYVNRIKTILKRKEIPVSETMTDNPFFCHFLTILPTIKAAAFSVSSQNCKYQNMTFYEKYKMRRGLANLSYISVRDEWTKKMVESVTGKKNILITPDPVFSFNQNCADFIPSKKDILQKFDLPEDYYLISFGQVYNNKKYIDKIVAEAHNRGIYTVTLPMPEGMFDIQTKKNISLPLDTLDWYALIKYSKGYVGERMHPIVVCLHNAVPFYCFDEYGVGNSKSKTGKYQYNPRSSKTYLIVEKAGFTDNIFSYKKNENMPSAVDVINKLLNFNREKCMAFATVYQKSYANMMLEVIKSVAQ